MCTGRWIHVVWRALRGFTDNKAIFEVEFNHNIIHSNTLQKDLYLHNFSSVLINPEGFWGLWPRSHFFSFKFDSPEPFNVLKIHNC